MITRVADWFEDHSQSIAFVLAVLLTPFFYVVSFPPFEVNEAAYVFLVPFVIWLSFSPRPKHVFLFGVGVGWLSWIVLIFWLHNVTWVGMALLAGVMGLHFAVWAWGTSILANRAWGSGMWSGVPLALGSSALWVVVENVRTHVFTGFPWLPLSASQVNEPIMLQSASVFGSWAVSFALVLLNIGIAAYLLRLVRYARTRKRGICPEFYLALSFVVGISFLLLRLSSGQEREAAFRAAVVQPNIPQDQKWDVAAEREILGSIELFTLGMKGSEPDAVFWPETVLPYPINDDGAMETWSVRLATELGAPIFAGALGIEKREDQLDWYNSVFLVRPEHGLFPLYYSKQHLVPFGEYIPLRWLWPWMEKVVPINGDILPGEESQLLPLYVGDTALRVGSLICFEDVFPAIARDAVKEGASILFVATNSAWYGESAAAAQHRAHSVLRAVETRRPVLRVGNDGWTGWIDEYGTVKEEFEPRVRTSGIFEITRDRRWVGRETFYVKYGDWFVWVCWGVMGVCWMLAPGLRD